MSVLIAKNTLCQLCLEERRCNPAVLGDKNFMKDKIATDPLDKDIGKVTIKILHSLNVQLKIKHKATESVSYTHLTLPTKIV